MWGNQCNFQSEATNGKRTKGKGDGMDPRNNIVNELDRIILEMNVLRESIQNNTSSGASTIVSKLTTIINGMEKLKTGVSWKI